MFFEETPQSPSGYPASKIQSHIGISMHFLNMTVITVFLKFRFDMDQPNCTYCTGADEGDLNTVVHAPTARLHAHQFQHRSLKIRVSICNKKYLNHTSASQMCLLQDKECTECLQCYHSKTCISKAPL
jgi:hypothetical protein